ncbi:hypothetical protein BGW38_007308, partial [Lunasporangiospora selenospora]
MKRKDDRQLEDTLILLSSNAGLSALVSSVKDEMRRMTLDGQLLYTGNGALEVYLKPTGRAGQGKVNDQVILDVFTYISLVLNNTTLNRGSQSTERGRAITITRAVQGGRMQVMGR